jgi:hypothetical protein
MSLAIAANLSSPVSTEEDDIHVGYRVGGRGLKAAAKQGQAVTAGEHA